MFCSTIITTIGRPTLGRAVQSVLEQSLPEAEFELIVVNDSGKPLAEASWQHDLRVRLVTTQRRERSVARNSGAAMARGGYLHFLDDDDWLAPGALGHFWRGRPGHEVGWIYGVSQLVDRQGSPLIELHHELTGSCFLQVMSGEWIPLQSSLIAARAFFDAGGFNPSLAGPEDIDLLRRVALRYDLAAVDELVAYVERGTDGSTTDYASHPRRSRWARERILDEASAFRRLQPGATDAYWCGRLARLYLTSMVWNLQHRRLMGAASRAIAALQAVRLAGARLFSVTFWRSLARAYQSPTFARGFALAKSVA